jgi:hypothetical protein
MLHTHVAAKQMHKWMEWCSCLWNAGAIMEAKHLGCYSRARRSLLMRFVLHSPLLPSLSTSFLQMHRHSDPLLPHETSKWCNPWRNHTRPSEISPHYLRAVEGSCSSYTDRRCVPTLDPNNAFSHDNKLCHMFQVQRMQPRCLVHPFPVHDHEILHTQQWKWCI